MTSYITQLDERTAAKKHRLSDRFAQKKLCFREGSVGDKLAYNLCGGFFAADEWEVLCSEIIGQRQALCKKSVRRKLPEVGICLTGG